MKIQNQSLVIEFNETFAIFVSVFSLCVLAVLVMLRQNDEIQPKKTSKSTLCCIGSGDSDDTEVLQRRYPGTSLSSNDYPSQRQSRYSDDEFYINHASQTRSIVKLDQIENCNFIYV